MNLDKFKPKPRVGRYEVPRNIGYSKVRNIDGVSASVKYNGYMYEWTVALVFGKVSGPKRVMMTDGDYSTGIESTKDNAVLTAKTCQKAAYDLIKKYQDAQIDNIELETMYV